MVDMQTILAQVDRAVAEGKITAAAVKNLRTWLIEPSYAEYAPQVAQHVAAEKWKELDDVFWTVIPFGTGGRRGKMYPIGTNAINDRTIGESAQGLADYAKEHVTDRPLACAIAYDTRHQSRHFAELWRKSWLRPDSRSISSGITEARPSFPSRFASSTVPAGSWSPPAITHPATMP